MVAGRDYSTKDDTKGSSSMTSTTTTSSAVAGIAGMAVASSKSASGAAASQIDAKREEFRKYLEKEGVMETLTRALVS